MYQIYGRLKFQFRRKQSWLVAAERIDVFLLPLRPRDVWEDEESERGEETKSVLKKTKKKGKRMKKKKTRKREKDTREPRSRLVRVRRSAVKFSNVERNYENTIFAFRPTIHAYIVSFFVSLIFWAFN